MIKTIQKDGKEIYYRVTGNGRPVLLVHGFGEDGEVWNNQVSYLKENFQLIAPDLPGSGLSEMIPDMSMEGMAELLVDILETEKTGPCPVIGHSMGGYITLALAEKYPQWVSAFGLFHSSAFADSEEKKATRRKGISFIEEHGAFSFLETATPNLFGKATKEKNPGLIEQQVNSLHNFSAPALVTYYEAMIARPDRTEVLRKTTVPVLFIMGIDDVAVPVEDGLKQCHLPEKSYIHILRQSGHMGMLEEPGKANLILEQFLAE